VTGRVCKPLLLAVSTTRGWDFCFPPPPHRTHPTSAGGHGGWEEEKIKKYFRV